MLLKVHQLGVVMSLDRLMFDVRKVGDRSGVIFFNLEIAKAFARQQPYDCEIFELMISSR